MKTTKRIYHKFAKKKTDNTMIVSFPYNPTTLEIVRNLSDKRYIKDTQKWECRITVENIQLLKNAGFLISEELEQFLSDEETESEQGLLELEHDPNSPYVLRPYQKQAVARGLQFIRDPRETAPSVLVLPTGAGKSVVIAEMTRRIRAKTIVLQPSKELLEQNYMKYVGYGEQAEIFSASLKRKKVAPVTFATIGSVINKMEMFTEFTLCIVDECHLVSPEEGTMYQNFFKTLKIKTLGLTATPFRMKSYSFPEPHIKAVMLDRMRPRYFKNYLYIAQISEMVNNDWWAELEYVEKEFDASVLRLNTTRADYTQKSLNEAWELNRSEKFIERLSRHRELHHILVFVPTVESAYALTKNVPGSAVLEAGIKAPEREKIVQNFRAGRIKMVINVNILSIGFDFPGLDCIVLARPTNSLLLHYQQIGRGVRPFPGKRCRVYDLVGNLKKFGKPETYEFKRSEGFMGLFSGDKMLTNVAVESLSPPVTVVPRIPMGDRAGERADALTRDELKGYLHGKPRNAIFLPLYDYLQTIKNK